MNIINVGYDSTNYYVLANATSRLLIDVGWPGTLLKLRHQLRAKGVALEELTHLLVTHYHPDHAGLAQEVKDLGVRLLVLEEQLPVIPELRRYMKPEHPYRDITLHDSIVTKIAESRAVLRRLGIDGEVIHTPGHSDDSVTLVADSGIAFVGDLPGPMYLLDESLHTIKHSWEAIRARGFTACTLGMAPYGRLNLVVGSTPRHHMGFSASQTRFDILDSDRIAHVAGVEGFIRSAHPSCGGPTSGCRRRRAAHVFVKGQASCKCPRRLILSVRQLCMLLPKSASTVDSYFRRLGVRRKKDISSQGA